MRLFASINRHVQTNREELQFSATFRLMLLIYLAKYIRNVSMGAGLPFPVAARSKAWVCGLLLAEIQGLNPTGRHGCLSVVSILCVVR